MAEETPNAVPENTGTEATTQPTNQPEQPAPQEQTTAPVLTEEQQAILRFVDGHGGLEKLKQTVTARTTDTQKAVQPQEPPKPTQEPSNVAEIPQKPNTEQIQQAPAGFQTQQEFIIEQYYNTLANKPEYAPIADKIRSGEVFKEMAKFNIVPVKDGMINQKQVNDFLSLYAKTVPPVAPANPITTTPTVDYVNVGDEITSRADAEKVMAQKGHPMHDKALQFIADQINGVKK